MLGTTVIIPSAIVPQMGGGNDEKGRVIQTALFVSGVNTLLQTFFGTRLPSVMSSSYAFVVPTISIILADRYSEIADPHERFKRIIRGTQGALIVASTVQIILGFSGLWRKVTSCSPCYPLVGMGFYELGFPGVGKCVEIGLPQLILLVVFSQYLPHVLPGQVFNRFAVLISVAIVWLYAYLLTVSGAYKYSPLKTQSHCRTDRSGLVGGAPWIRFPYPFQWGTPTFNAGEAFAMVASAFVALVESTGTYIAISRYASATPLPPSVLSRGIGWQGVAVLLDGLFGTANGSSVSVENAGLLGLTHVGSRRVVQVSAGFMIFFSILGKFGAVFASIPAPMVAALYCLLFAYAGAAGLGLQFCNLNSFRTKFILGFSIFLGLSVPQYFNEYTAVAGYGPVHTRARWFNDMVNVVFSSEAVVAALVAFLLDTPCRCMIRRTFKGDTRTEEFYSLPFKLNKFFPAA
ncbi:unnamed protein product [Spirodela intermedia]|uniref:Uncharacterized protein n=1 Tax=Spirodela intermedia TaxID=51605 RepID=A0A7I8IUG7_SPIIN|nr:unnamed protein product [Spirodela intermedia]CAA6661468.1 unnamed protein product [Spirodela intermedia]